MLTQYHMKMPGAVYSGEGALENIISIIQGRFKKAAVFTDPGITKAGLLIQSLALLREAGAEYTVLDRIPAEPTCEQAQDIIDQFRSEQADLIVAVGGGSVMDIAKLASILADGETSVRELLEHPGQARKSVKTLMIPTTAGTGAEATPNSIVAVPERELKVGIVNDEMIPDYVILDGEMIKKLPRAIAASTGVDALAHAIECFTSNKANPFSDIYALEALRLILGNIEEACSNEEAMEAKRAMQIAAFYAGAAITSSGTTAVHALSYPLGGKYHIPHGVSNAMLLVPVMKFNEPVVRERFAAVYDCVMDGGSGLNLAEKSSWLIGRLEEIVKNLDIPSQLSEFGIGKQDLDVLVEAGMGVTRLLNNNRRQVTTEDARDIYLQIME